MVTSAISVIPLDPSARSELIGSNQGLRKVWGSLHETGRDKELVVKAIEESIRKCGPYVKLKSAATPCCLPESELFVHGRGAFTEALTQTAGRFQHTHTGTRFLNEIGDLPLGLRPKLLRALQEQKFERLGSNRAIRVDVRSETALNQNLHQIVRERPFRADLLWFNVFPIALPPLGGRPEDIPLLVEHSFRKCASRMNKEPGHISKRAMEACEAV